MDKLTRYRNAVRLALNHFTKGTYLPPQYLKYVTVFDAVNDRYAVITQGWDKGGYVNELTAEVDIVDGKVLIQFNNTDIGIKQLLLENGVDEADIVIPSLEKYNLTHRKARKSTTNPFKAANRTQLFFGVENFFGAHSEPSVGHGRAAGGY